MKKIFIALSFGAFLLAFGTSALADLRGPYELQNWRKTVLAGPLSLAINPTMGPSPFAEFSYAAPPGYDYGSRMAAFSATAPSTGAIAFDWEYYFSYSRFYEFADHLWVYADGPSGLTWQYLVDFFNLEGTGPKTFTGSASIVVTEGYEFGLVVWGSNYDYSQIEGKVTLTNFLSPDTNIPVLIDIDIKPGSVSNSINPKSKGKIPVAILSTAEFDAPNMINQDSLTFGHQGDEDSLAFCNARGEDVNVDGLPDLVCHFYTQVTGFGCDDAEGILRGNTTNDKPIEGRDSVRIKRCK